MTGLQMARFRRASLSRGVVIALVFAAVTFGATVGAASLRGIASSPEEEIRAALDQYSLDPRIAGLGATSYDEVEAISGARAELQTAIVDLAVEEPSFAAFAYRGRSRASLESRGLLEPHRDLIEFVEIQKALDRSVEDLYRRASQTEFANELQALWRECMQARGRNFASPSGIERAISERSLEDEEIDGVLRDRDECTAELETDFEYFLLTDYIPAWSEENADLLERYAESLVPPSDE